MPPRRRRRGRSTAMVGVDLEIIEQVDLLGLRPQMHKVFDRVKREVSDVGESEIRGTLGRRIQESTGDYIGQIADRDINGVFRDRVITDQGAVQGPWLEGGSRNTGKTRFKGYRAFRRARTKMRALAKSSMGRAISQLIQQWNR